MSVLLKKLRSGKTKTTDGVALSPQDSSSGSHTPVEKDTGKSTARDVSEPEANRKLSVFEQAHRWDPNLGDDALDDIDDAVHHRDPAAEGKLVGEIFENSPYPEV